MARKTAFVIYHLKGKKITSDTKRMYVEQTKGDTKRVLKRRHPNWVIDEVDFD